MADIRPFRALQFTEKAGSLKDLTAPPYDVISDYDRVSLAAESKYNIIHLTLPLPQDDDRSKFIKYARSAATLSEWRREGILALAEKASFFRYVQQYVSPVSGKQLERTCLMTLLKVEPYSEGVVLPHEQTFPKHKEDRLRILEATRTHLECIFGLYQDDSSEILEHVKKAPFAGLVEVKTDDGIMNRLEPISDAESITYLENAFKDRQIWIADGHHRYETAVDFRAAQGPKNELIAEDFILIALTSMSDPGLELLPTHRLIKKLPVSEEILLDRLTKYFEVKQVHASHLIPDMARIANEEGKRVLSLLLEGSRGFLLIERDSKLIDEAIGSEGSIALNHLDITILHSLILPLCADVKGLDNIVYTRSERECIVQVDGGQASAAFLMNPPTSDEMKTISLNGEKMPQKSTYYYPKIVSGLVLWSLNDF